MIEIFVVAAAGVLGGASNVLAGGGSLITFPTLVALGVSPLSANVTNTVGLVPGAIGGAAGSADLLAGQERRLLRLGLPLTLGAAGGAALLLVTPAKSFEAVVPGLVAISCLLLLLQPRLAHLSHAGNERSPYLFVGMLLAGAYAGYFGSAAGILLLALLALFVTDTIHRLNAGKIVLNGLASLLAAVCFAVLAPVTWTLAVALMVGSWAGGHWAAKLARRVDGERLRVAIALAGLAVAAALAVKAYT
ncbi:MAG: hypothetical protein BGO11_14120 [Solirubrobacterales bacterium 70-9]|nr:MAG: hypothetical protein BGO11_14120 [Solirubrobacterales bacterium 70-9]